MEHPEYTAVIEGALARLDLDDKCRLLAGRDLWSLPALPEIGLESVVMSDGPVGVRGGEWNPSDPSLTLPSPTALAATWDPELARRAGRVLAQEAHRKGVGVVLAPTVNIHRSPRGGRHFECYSEDPLLTARIGVGCVTGLQECGVAATVKHFTANDAETDRFTVDNRIGARALREIYLAPFEQIIAEARPWLLMSAYNGVNGATMTENRPLQTGVLREEWGYDGVVVSDWLAARDTVRAIEAGLDVAMPGPLTVYGGQLAAAVRDGRVAEAAVDTAVRRVLLLAARLGLLAGAEPAVPADARPEPVDGRELAREIAARSVVLLHNQRRVLPLDTAELRSIALIGRAAREARILGGGSATVFPAQVVSPMDGLLAALPEGVRLDHAIGTDPDDRIDTTLEGFELRTVLRDADGRVLAESPLPEGRVRWMATHLPGGADYAALATVEVVGSYTPKESGRHQFGVSGQGPFRLVVDGQVLMDASDGVLPGAQAINALLGNHFDATCAVELEAGRTVELSLTNFGPKAELGPIRGVAFGLGHLHPERDEDGLIDEAVAAAEAADVAVVVVATNERVESEGSDRSSLRLPGRQDELVARVAAANPRTVVVVNAGAPVEMPWREDVAAVLLCWFPGQEGGAALAGVLLGQTEPGGRLPTTWPIRLADAPVHEVAPTNGVLRYDEGIFVGYRAWQRHRVEPAYPFGHGLGYTTWEYEGAEADADCASLRIQVRNSGSRPGREVVQVYLAAADSRGQGLPERPERRLAGFTTVEAGPGEVVEAEIALPERAFRIWDETEHRWSTMPGGYRAEIGRSVADLRLGVELGVRG